MKKTMIEKLYLLTLIFLPILPKFPISHGGMLNSIASYFFLIGFASYLIKEKIVINKNIFFFGKILCFLIFLNTINSFKILFKFGIVKNSDALTMGLRQIIFYIWPFLIFSYNEYLLKKYSKKEVYNYLMLGIKILLVIGVIQIFCIIFPNEIIQNFYNSTLGKISRLNIFKLKKIYLLCTEPAATGSLLCIFIIPFLIFKYESSKRKKDFLFLILSIVILFFTKSTTAYIGFIILLCINFIFKTSVKLLFIYLIFLIIILLNIDLLSPFLLKAINLNNLSTVHRYSSIYTNSMAFINNFIFGVGLGGHGFYYLEYIPNWALKSYETQSLLHSNKVPYTGGSITSEYIAAFGLIGIILYCFILIKIYFNIKNNDKKEKLFFYTVLINSVILGVVSFHITNEIWYIMLINIMLIENSKNIRRIYEINDNNSNLK